MESTASQSGYGLNGLVIPTKVPPEENARIEIHGPVGVYPATFLAVHTQYGWIVKVDEKWPDLEYSTFIVDPNKVHEIKEESI